MKNNSFAGGFFIVSPFAVLSLFLRREMSFFAVVLTDQKRLMTIFPFHLQIAYTNLIPGLLVQLLQVKFVLA